jgi:hypothetical protein
MDGRGRNGREQELWDERAGLHFGGKRFWSSRRRDNKKIIFYNAGPALTRELAFRHSGNHLKNKEDASAAFSPRMIAGFVQ